MTITELKHRKKELGFSNAQIAELAGVPLGTVQKIFSGETTSPRYSTLQALETLLAKSKPSDGFYVQESSAPYLSKRQGEYNLEDYYNLPEEHRYELIDGVLYNMSTPIIAHQLIAGYIHSKFLVHITSKKGECIPMVSPMGVQLDCDDKTMVEPDVLIVCDRDKLNKRCVYGAPDFVLEVLSPSTKKKDMFIKLNKYMNAGVREYWMIDPEQKKVMIYNFEKEDYPSIFGFDQVAPVAVLNNECKIDFNDLFDYISFLYDQK